jgi:hypothetical protein
LFEVLKNKRTKKNASRFSRRLAIYSKAAGSWQQKALLKRDA